MNAYNTKTTMPPSLCSEPVSLRPPHFTGLACEKFLAGATVILTRSIYLSMFVRRFSPPQTAAAARRLAAAWHNISTNSVRQNAGVRNVFPAHCVGVTTMSARYNLYPSAVKKYRQHRPIHRHSHHLSSQPKCV